MYISTTGSLKRVIGSISTYVNAVIFILLYCIYHTLIATRTENNGILQNSLLKNQNICYTQFNMMLAISAYMYIQTQNNSNRKREIISILTQSTLSSYCTNPARNL